jgi:hypothetical protein
MDESPHPELFNEHSKVWVFPATTPADSQGWPAQDAAGGFGSTSPVSRLTGMSGLDQGGVGHHSVVAHPWVVAQRARPASRTVVCGICWILGTLGPFSAGVAWHTASDPLENVRSDYPKNIPTPEPSWATIRFVVVVRSVPGHSRLRS